MVVHSIPWAKRLASEGVIVYAPDLRGYGRWLDEKSASGGSKARLETDYDSSYLDLVTLIREAKDPGLPLYCIGESLGTAMILRAAAGNAQRCRRYDSGQPCGSDSIFLYGQEFEQLGAATVAPA